MATKSKATKKTFVVIRTYSAGVHYGELVESNGKEVVLHNTRRIWSWKGRNTLNEIANHGVGAGSRVSEACSRNRLTEVIEELACSDESIKNMESASWVP